MGTTADSAGTCSPAPAVCPSLRQAITTINGSPSPPDVINVPAGHYVLGGTSLNIANDMTISGSGDGAGAGATTIDANGASRVFTADGVAVARLTLSGMNVVGGNSGSDDGGGIKFFSSVAGAVLNLSGVAFTGDTAASGQSGGAVFFEDNGEPDTLNITDSTISGNTVSGGGSGAGIFVTTNGGGAVTIAGSTVSDNTGGSAPGGGGLYFDGATLSITNSTFSGNTAQQGAGLYIVNPPPFTATTLTNDTIANNSLTPAGASSGAGILGGATVTAINTIVSGNTGASPASTDNCDAAVHSSDHSLEFNGLNPSGCGFDLVSGDPMLAPLADNGGPTETMALAVGSPAIDAGDSTHCPATDQRTFVRPDVSGTACDVGAFEFGAVARGAPTASITTPGAGATFAVGQIVDASYVCAPDAGGTLKPGRAGCAGPVSDGAAIDTSSAGVHTFTVVATDIDGQTGSATSSYTVIGAPVSTGPPIITGNPKAGSTLICSTGSWTNAPTSFAYQWYRDGTPLAGATTAQRTVQTLDEGTTLTCSVTAANMAGEATAQSSGVNVSIPFVARCPGATGKLSGATLGLVKLGMTRSRAHYLYRHHSDRGKQYEDFFCLTPIGVRVGYGSPKLLKILTKSQRKHLLKRVVWSSTSNPYYSIDGVRPGESIAAASVSLHTEPPFHIGLNYWYLARQKNSTAVLKVRDGVVEEIGIGDNQLTNGRKAQLIFMKSFY